MLNGSPSSRVEASEEASSLLRASFQLESISVHACRRLSRLPIPLESASSAADSSSRNVALTARPASSATSCNKRGVVITKVAKFPR